MTKVLIHPFSSLLSAYGMGLADIRATRQQAIEEPLGDSALAAIATIGGRLGEDAKTEVDGPRRARARHRGASCAPTSATPAPTPRWWCRLYVGAPRRPHLPLAGEGREGARTKFERAFPLPTPPPQAGGSRPRDGEGRHHSER